MTKILTKVAVSFCALLLTYGCSSSDQPQTENKQPATQTQQETQSSPHGAGTSTVAGIVWSIPAGWASAGEKPMRVATYLIDPADPKAECAVYYFGEGQGGAMDANITRWINQVKQPDGSESAGKAERGKVDSECCEIATVEVNGTYLFSAGPMMQTQEERPDYILMAGIAPAPQGNVFFKLTGPKANANQYRATFDTMLKSIKKGTT